VTLRTRVTFGPRPCSPGERDFATELVSIGHGSGVITFSSTDSRPVESRLTRHFGRSRSDDHGIRMTSLVIRNGRGSG
jgi:hypothetical protein